MAGEHGGDALFYDFLIDEPEQIATPTATTSAIASTSAAEHGHGHTTTAGNATNAPHSSPHLEVDFAAHGHIATDGPHLGHLQQAIPVANRTSPQPQRHLPPEIAIGGRHEQHQQSQHHAQHHPQHQHHGTGQHALLPVPVAAAGGGAGASARANAAAAPPPLSAPAQLEMGLHHHQMGQSRAASRHLAPSHHPGALDLHGHHQQLPQSITPTSYSTPVPSASAVSAGSMPVDWGMYGVTHHSVPLHPSQFEFDLHGGAMMPSMSHHGHISPSVTDPALNYGGGVVSPSSIHSSQSQYGFSSSWEDHMGHEGSTPTVTTPAAQFAANPWTDPEELHQETDQTQKSRPKKATRSRRTKKDARRNSNSDSRTGPSPDAASPSSSHTSRASINSKSGSLASSSVASSSIASSSTTSSRPTKLRSASRTSKNSHNKPNDTPEERRTRASHNLVEKQYRNRLNTQFESLLNVLPEQIRAGNNGDDSDGADWGDRRVSKGEVLEMARKHIKSLEEERDMLEREKNELQGNLAQLKNSHGESSSSNTPLNFNDSMDDSKSDDPNPET